MGTAVDKKIIWQILQKLYVIQRTIIFLKILYYEKSTIVRKIQTKYLWKIDSDVPNNFINNYTPRLSIEIRRGWSFHNSLFEECNGKISLCWIVGLKWNKKIIWSSSISLVVLSFYFLQLWRRYWNSILWS